MSGHAADRNLLFGVFAHQMEFLTRDQLVEGMGAWVLEKSRPLEDILVEKGHLAASDRDLVALRIEQHAGDVAQSLKANVSAAASQQSLGPIADDDVMQNPKSMDSTVIGADLHSTASMHESSEAAPLSNGLPKQLNAKQDWKARIDTARAIDRSSDCRTRPCRMSP